MKILQNIIGGIIIYLGLISLYTESIIPGLFLLFLGIVLMPYFLNRILSILRIEIKPIGKIIIRAITILIAVFSIHIEEQSNREFRRNAITSSTKYFESKVKDLATNAESDIDKDLMYIDSVYSLHSKYLTPKEKIFHNDVQVIRSKNNIALYLDSLNEREYDELIENQLDKKFFDSSNLNRILISKISKIVKKEKDFKTNKEYLIYRAERAYLLEDYESFENNLYKAMNLRSKYVIPDRLFRNLIKIKKAIPKTKEYNILDAYNLALKNNSKSEYFLKELGDELVSQEKYKQAIRTYARYLKLNNSNPKVYTSLGMSYEKIKNKSKAKLNYRNAINIEGKGGEACRRLRELTIRIVGYNYYSKCCDGTTSSSTGRGTCSHHGGVCYKMKEPIMGYTMDCE
jgi:tetratricopeptide (TPR) repeat protein